MDFLKLDKSLNYLEQLVRLEQVCGLEPFSREMLIECIEEMDTYAFVDGNSVCGFISIHSGAKYLGGALYIVNLNIAPEYRRQGIGEKLMRTALAQYGLNDNQLVMLDVLKTNTPALCLYQKLGFAITDLPSANGDTDCVMMSSLRNISEAVHTERLTLRPFSLCDTERLGNIFRDSIIKQTYMIPDLNMSEANSLARKIALLSCDHSRYVRGIYLGETLIGLLNDVDITNGCIELGWAIDPAYHNQGYGSEAVAGAIAQLFDRGYTEVLAGAFSENTASLRVMQKCGMQMQEQTEEIEYRGETHKCVYYAIRRNI